MALLHVNPRAPKKAGEDGDSCCCLAPREGDLHE
jgi:hypothetical protein